MIGQIKQTVVNQYAWLKEEEFLQGMALCQLIPGATMVQMVTYVGYRLRGFWGALISAFAFILPAFIALLILSMFYFKMETIPFIHALFKGLGAIVVAIVLNASITLGKPIIKDWKVILQLLFPVKHTIDFCISWSGCYSAASNGKPVEGASPSED
jgi:chromate transporter